MPHFVDGTVDYDEADRARMTHIAWMTYLRWTETSLIVQLHTKFTM